VLNKHGRGLTIRFKFLEVSTTYHAINSNVWRFFTYTHKFEPFIIYISMVLFIFKIKDGLKGYVIHAKINLNHSPLCRHCYTLSIFIYLRICSNEIKFTLEQKICNLNEDIIEFFYKVHISGC
jgi:hypothetical protein